VVTKESFMGKLEERNLEVVKRWAETYNNDVDLMVSECYAENCSAASMLGGSKIEGHSPFRKLERRVLKAAPKRKIRLEHTHAAGDVVVVEATLLDPDQGDAWQSPFCAVLTFKDGKIVEDRTYLDETRWPGGMQKRAQ
jgi:ketosteroid isomerase-like protein